MSLQNLCLNTIVENFNRYFSTYSNSDDVNLKRKFEFLQRIYSQEIATKLFEEFEMEEKHVDFVINKYLKSLDTKWFGNCSWKTVVTKMAEIGPKIKKIYFNDFSEKGPWHEIFCYLPNLEEMYYLICTDEVLSSIAEYCPNIQEIELRCSYYVTEDGFKSLCKLKNGNASCSKLKNIIINYHYLPAEAAKHLVKNLPSLEVFQYYHLPQLLYAMHHKDLPTIDKVTPYKFTKLNLTASVPELPYYGDLLKMCVSLCPNLKSLECSMVKPQQLNLVSELSNLETLFIKNYHEEDFLDVNDFLKLKESKLTSLRLCECLVSLTNLAKNCPSLNYLHLTNVIVECDETSIPLFKNLNALTIEISELGVSDENLKSACLILSSSPKLESMAFIECKLTSSEVKAEILKCCEQSLIKRIDLYTLLVERQFILDILFTCHSLLRLDLCGELDIDDEEAIIRVAELLPNKPDIYFDDDDDYDSNYNHHYNSLISADDFYPCDHDHSLDYM